MASGHVGLMPSFYGAFSTDIGDKIEVSGNKWAFLSQMTRNRLEIVAICQRGCSCAAATRFSAKFGLTVIHVPPASTNQHFVTLQTLINVSPNFMRGIPRRTGFLTREELPVFQQSKEAQARGFN